MSDGRGDRGQRLEVLAEAVTDDRPVDWGAEAGVSPELAPAIRALERLEQISRARQRAGAVPVCALDLQRPREGVESGGSKSEPKLFRWGPLDVIQKLAEGSFGEIYRAYDPALRRHVALKLRIRGECEPRSARRWFEEAHRLARVRHPHVLVVYGAAAHDGRAGIWTELLSGQTLEDSLEEHGPMSPREVALIGIDLCAALAAVHAAGLVHGDVKASNIMLEEPQGSGGRSGSARVVLLDFGSGCEWRPENRDSSTPVFGSPLSTAPEVLAGNPATPRTDLYSLGALLYRLTTGRFVVEANSLDELRARLEHGDRVPLTVARRDVPPAFARVVDRAVARDPAQRFQCADDMGQALLASIGGRPECGAMEQATGRALAKWIWRVVLMVGALFLAAGSLRNGRAVGTTATEARAPVVTRRGAPPMTQEWQPQALVPAPLPGTLMPLVLRAARYAKHAGRLEPIPWGDLPRPGELLDFVVQWPESIPVRDLKLLDQTRVYVVFPREATGS